MSYLIANELLSLVVGGCDKPDAEAREITKPEHRAIEPARFPKDEQNRGVEDRAVEHRQLEQR